MYHNTLATQLQNTCNTPATKNIRRASGIEWQHFRSFDECAATHLKRTCKAPATHLEQAFPDAHLSVLHSNVRLGSFDECEATHLQHTCEAPTTHPQQEALDAHPALNGNISDLLMNVLQHTCNTPAAHLQHACNRMH